MPLIAILIAAVVLAIPVAIVVLLIAQSNLKKRLSIVEAQLRALYARSGDPNKLTTARPDQTSEKQVSSAISEPQLAAKEDTKHTGPEKQEEQPSKSPFPWPQAKPASTPTAVSVTQTPAEPPPPQGPSWFDKLLPWLQDNWFYVVSAVSLGLAGIFLVQYGIEQGLIPPTVRVLCAMLFGGALIGAGEYIRRRWGDGEDASTAFLPSTFSAAGIVVLYAAVIAAHGLYGLIGPELAFVGLLAVSVVSVIFGWFYGPFLAAAGLSGAAAAPFLVDGNADSGLFFYLYYGILGAVALTIDAMRRWGWVSLLGLTLSYLLGAAVLNAGGEFHGFAALMGWLALAAIALPRLELWPTHPAPSPLESLSHRSKEKASWPTPPVWIATGAVLASCLFLLVAAAPESVDAQYLTLFLFAGLTLALILWARNARGLVDLALIPATSFLTHILVQRLEGDMYRDFIAQAITLNPEASFPIMTSVLIGLATLISLAAFWRSFRDPHFYLWALGATLFAPVTALILELAWYPRAVIGAYPWACHVIAIAGMMVLFAERYARNDEGDKRRAAWATLSALSLIALALFVLLAQAALTVALSVLIVTAAVLDRRYRLFEMNWFILLGVLVLGYRLTFDPGLLRYVDDAPLYEVVLAFGSALIGLGLAWVALPEGERRSDTRSLLASGLWSFGGVFATVLLYRFIENAIPSYYWEGAWSASLIGLMWGMLALAQIYRLRTGVRMRIIPILMALVFGLLSIGVFLLSLTLLNPWFGHGDDVQGPLLVDTALVAYGLPGILLILLSLRANWLPWKPVWRWAGIGFVALYGFLEVRRFWHEGQTDARFGFSQPELYTYTVVLLVTGGTLLYQSIARHSPLLRRLAITVIGIAVAKVFLVDISGLTGLLRVFSFLALGLVLAGLAWLNRWAALQLTKADQSEG